MRIGVDLVDAGRIRRILQDRPGFRTLVFTENELTCAGAFSSEGRQVEYLAGRFAVKEAVMKALGTGMTDEILFTEIETLHDSSEAPVLRLFGKALDLAGHLGLSSFQTSISHDAGMVVAFVILS